MWCISAVLLWSFFMAFYHSITVLQIWVGLLLLCSSMHWSSSSWSLSHTNTPCQAARIMENTHTSKLDFSIEHANHLHPCAALSEVAADSMITEKLSFSQLLRVRFGCKRLVCVQWFRFCLSDHLMIMFFFSNHVHGKHCFWTLLVLYIYNRRSFHNFHGN